MEVKAQTPAVAVDSLPEELFAAHQQSLNAALSENKDSAIQKRLEFLSDRLTNRWEFLKRSHAFIITGGGKDSEYLRTVDYPARKAQFVEWTRTLDTKIQEVLKGKTLKAATATAKAAADNQSKNTNQKV